MAVITTAIGIKVSTTIITVHLAHFEFVLAPAQSAAALSSTVALTDLRSTPGD